MGYRGKLAEQEKARELRAQNLTLADIAAELGVAKSSVSLWVRDVPFTPSKRRYGPRVRPNALMQRKQDEIAWANDNGSRRIGPLSEREFLVAGAALYAGEGAKRDGMVVFTKSDPALMVTFVAWLRHFFPVDESRLRVRLYLHDGLDVDAAIEFWAQVTGVPAAQFHKPQRPKADPSRRGAKHIHGCASLQYTCAKTHREVMGLVRALLTCDLLPG